MTRKEAVRLAKTPKRFLIAVDEHGEARIRRVVTVTRDITGATQDYTVYPPSRVSDKDKTRLLRSVERLLTR